MAINLTHSLQRVGLCTDMQGHESVLVDSVGIGTVLQQQFDALRLTLFAGLMQSSGAPGGKIHLGSS